MHCHSGVNVGILLAYRSAGLAPVDAYLVAINILREFRVSQTFGADILDVASVVSRFPAFEYQVFAKCPLIASDAREGVMLAYHWVGSFLLFTYGKESDYYQLFSRSINKLHETDASFVTSLINDIFFR